MSWVTGEPVQVRFGKVEDEDTVVPGQYVRSMGDDMHKIQYEHRKGRRLVASWQMPIAP